MKRIPVILAGAVLAAATLSVASLTATSPVVAATPPPPPPNPNVVVTPSATMQPMQPTPTPIPLLTIGKTPAPSASPKASPKAPEDKRVGYEGVWEVQIQRGDQTIYTHWNLKQTDNALTGTYLDKDNKRYPIAGSIDGTNIRLVVSMPDGTTRVFTGRVTGTTDMLGMMAQGTDSTPFTAAYRPKENWLENVNAAPGGMGMPNSTNPSNPNVPH